MNYTLPHIDLISFGFGFLLASVFWLVILRISKLLPNMRKTAAENRQRQLQKKDLDREHGLRLFALRKAQNSHLASTLFSLDTILVQPQVITSQKALPNSNDESVGNSMFDVLPDMPEAPELLADFPVVKNSLLTILQAGQQYIAISARPGYGKTTALAALTSELCLSYGSNEAAKGYLPIFFNYSEIEQLKQSSLDDLANYLSKNIKSLSLATLNELILHANSSQRLVILIDGLDLLPLSDLGKAIQWIKDMQTSLSKSAIVTVCDPFLNGDLESNGFEIFTLAAWGVSEKHRFFYQWKDAWTALDKDEARQHKAERTLRWLVQEENQESPRELTLKAWSAFSGVSEGPSSTGSIKSYLNLITGGWLTQDGAEALAGAAEVEPIPAIHREKAHGILNLTPNAIFSVDHFTQEETLPESSTKDNKPSEEKGCSPGEILDLLIDNHFFYPIPGENLLFSDLNLFALLVSKQNGSSALVQFSEVAQSPLKRLIFENKQISQTNFHDIDSWLGQGDIPLHRDHLFALSWLSHTGKGDPLREKIFRQTARLLQDNSFPAGFRYRFLFPLIRTKDSSIGALFNYFSSNPDSSIRQIAALSLGILEDDKNLASLVKLSKDDVNEVQKVACLALSKIWSQSAQDALVDMVFSADEPIRALACELFSLHSPEGHQMLQEITTTDNYLARKAAISGLVHINQLWVIALLEKLSVEDTQWVVRDAAKFALENPLLATSFVAQKHIPIRENPWTLQKANVYNIELQNQGNMTDLLYAVLNNDPLFDKRIALNYLLDQPTPKLINLLRNLSQNTQSDFREDAINALFNLSKRGLNLEVH